MYCIAATHKKTGQRLLIKVRSLVTREQLLVEIRRMNMHAALKDFIYALSTEGARI